MEINEFRAHPFAASFGPSPVPTHFAHTVLHSHLPDRTLPVQPLASSAPAHVLVGHVSKYLIEDIAYLVAEYVDDPFPMSASSLQSEHTALVMSLPSDQLALCRGSSSIKVVDLSSGECVRELEIVPSSLSSYHTLVGPSQCYFLAACVETADMRIYNPANGACLLTFAPPGWDGYTAFYGSWTWDAPSDTVRPGPPNTVSPPCSLTDGSENPTCITASDFKVPEPSSLTLERDKDSAPSTSGCLDVQQTGHPLRSVTSDACSSTSAADTPSTAKLAFPALRKRSSARPKTGSIGLGVISVRSDSVSIYRFHPLVTLKPVSSFKCHRAIFAKFLFLRFQRQRLLLQADVTHGKMHYVFFHLPYGEALQPQVVTFPDDSGPAVRFEMHHVDFPDSLTPQLPHMGEVVLAQSSPRSKLIFFCIRPSQGCQFSPFLAEPPPDEGSVGSSLPPQMGRLLSGPPLPAHGLELHYSITVTPPVSAEGWSFAPVNNQPRIVCMSSDGVLCVLDTRVQQFIQLVHLNFPRSQQVITVSPSGCLVVSQSAFETQELHLWRPTLAAEESLDDRDDSGAQR